MHLPVHASWLNQIEIVFSVIQRKVIKPADFADLDALAARLTAFEPRYNATASPFDWRFTRADLDDLLRRIDAHRPARIAARQRGGRRLNQARMSRCRPRRHPPRPACGQRLNRSRPRPLARAGPRSPCASAASSPTSTAHLPDGEIMPLCRLRYGGSASTWGFAIYLASRDGYEDSILPNGSHRRQPRRSPRLRLRPLPQRPHRLAPIKHRRTNRQDH